MKRTLLVLLVLVAALGTGFLYFAESLPDEPSADTRRTDAIVVLTGGAQRVAEGLRLLADERADHLLISGVHPDTTLESLLALAPDVTRDLSERIHLDREAADTLGNARETAAWAKAAGVESLRVVTAGYHMPRSLLELQRALPDVELIAHPVFPESVSQVPWWQSADTTGLFLREYLKYLVVLVSASDSENRTS
ncbi:MAG: YdcF family protein [Pseudomonadota bacterium]